jgi:hypothetical protein
MSLNMLENDKKRLSMPVEYIVKDVGLMDSKALWTCR